MIRHTSPEGHPPKQSVSSDELVVERGKRVQNDEADKEQNKQTWAGRAR